jgi:hypothetical protein
VYWAYYILFITQLNKIEMSLFRTFLEQHLAYNQMDFVPIGGFIPGQSISVFQDNILEAADESESSRSIVLFSTLPSRLTSSGTNDPLRNDAIGSKEDA